MLKLLLLVVAVIAVCAALAVTPKRPKPAAPAVAEPRSPEKVIGKLTDDPLVEEVQSPRPELFRLAIVRGEDGIAALSKLDALETAQGWRTVLLGAKADLPEFDAFDIEDPNAILKAADAIDAEKLLEQRAREATGDDAEEQDLLGEWPQGAHPEAALPEKYSVLRDVLTNQFHDHVYIALVPTDEAWKIPAYLQNGSWNEVPSPAEQVSVLRYWSRKHGARLRAFSSDVMELEVARLPGNKNEALALARQQFGFCSDIVWQGVGALRPHAAGLEHAGNWYFWWD